MLRAAKFLCPSGLKQLLHLFYSNNVALVIPRHAENTLSLSSMPGKPSVKFFYIFGYLTMRKDDSLTTIHVLLDELPHMASDHVSSDTDPTCSTTLEKTSARNRWRDVYVRTHRESKPEQRNIKRSMGLISAMEESMQEELHQMFRLDVWILVGRPLCTNVITESGSMDCDPYHPDQVYRLKKALYGIKQAPRAWYDELSNFLGYKTLDANLCVCRYQAKTTEKKHLDLRLNDLSTLKTAINMGLWYRRTRFRLTAFSDSDQAGSLDSRLRYGLVAYNFRVVIRLSPAGHPKKGRICTSMSTAEAEEYYSISCNPVLHSSYQAHRCPDSLITGTELNKGIALNFLLSYALSWKPCQGDSLNLPDHRAQVDQGSQIKMIQVKEMMQDNDLKNSKSKDKGSKSRSQSMDEQSHYKQDKTITRQSINVKRHIFNVIGGTEEFEKRDINIGGDC
ncbi:gag-pol polyprotein [Tanacetum coccineum]